MSKYVNLFAAIIWGFVFLIGVITQTQTPVYLSLMKSFLLVMSYVMLYCNGVEKEKEKNDGH